jgi:hypothetical protein
MCAGLSKGAVGEELCGNPCRGVVRSLTAVLLRAWLQRLCPRHGPRDRSARWRAAHHRGNSGVDDSDMHCTAGCGDDNAAVHDCGHAEPEQLAAVPLVRSVSEDGTAPACDDVTDRTDEWTDGARGAVP